MSNVFHQSLTVIETLSAVNFDRLVYCATASYGLLFLLSIETFLHFSLLAESTTEIQHPLNLAVSNKFNPARYSVD